MADAAKAATTPTATGYRFSDAAEKSRLRGAKSGTCTGHCYGLVHDRPTFQAMLHRSVTSATPLRSSLGNESLYADLLGPADPIRLGTSGRAPRSNEPPGRREALSGDGVDDIAALPAFQRTVSASSSIVTSLNNDFAKDSGSVSMPVEIA
jgi:hypothetical protein